MWRYPYQEVKIKVATPWRKWWAWKPVTTVNGQRIWFKCCYRRYAGWYQYGVVQYTSEEYGTIFDVLNYPNK